MSADGQTNLNPTCIPGDRFPQDEAIFLCFRNFMCQKYNWMGWFSGVYMIDYNGEGQWTL